MLLLIDKCYCNNYIRTTLLVILFTLPARAQNIIDWGGDKLLNTYLMQQLHQQYALRDQKVRKALQSTAGILAYQQQLRTAYKQLLGTLPAKTPLHTAITGRLQQNGYHIEKIIYQSFPGHHVTANLYLPSGKGPFPGLLLFCGHEPEAKATPSYQQTAILLARSGFIVLMIDPVSQGERHQLTDSTGRPLTRGGTTEHTLLNAAAALIGSSVAAYELWDNEQGLEYLLSRKEVDTTRIGCLGNSGGGTQTAYFMAFDSRIKAAAVCSYITTRERTFELAGPLDGCVQIPGEGKKEMDITDYMHLLAPKPLLVLSGRYDFVDFTGAQKAYTEAQLCYNALGAPDHIRMVTVDDGHGISQPKREAAARWFRKWFYKDDRPVHERPSTVLRPDSLFATATGEVNSSFTDEVSLQQHILQSATALADKRQQFLRTTNTKNFADTLRRLLGITQQRAQVQAEQIQTADDQKEKLLLRCDNEPPLPVIMIRPPAHTPVKELLIFLHDDGKNKLLDSATLIKSYMQKGYIVLLPDLRGIGETADNPEFNHPKLYNKEYRNAISSLHLGKPLMGQRVTDLQILLDYLRANTSLRNYNITLKASGLTAMVALHAAAVDDRISRVEADHYLHSFLDITRNVIGKNWYGYIVPGVLKYYDIQDLIRIVDKRFAFP